MSKATATRTLVKSPPELWAECSQASSLGRHLPQFGEIRITKLDPETAVAWEGESVSGTVRIEPSGWGTTVTFTATAGPVEEPAVAEPEAAPEPEAVPEPEAAAAPETAAATPPPARGRGLFARLLVRLGFRSAPEPEPVAVEPPAPAPEPEASEPEPEPSAPEPSAPEPEPVATKPEPETPTPSAAAELEQIEVALTAALDSLGQAHHRPFSRA